MKRVIKGILATTVTLCAASSIAAPNFRESFKREREEIRTHLTEIRNAKDAVQTQRMESLRKQSPALGSLKAATLARAMRGLSLKDGTQKEIEVDRTIETLMAADAQINKNVEGAPTAGRELIQKALMLEILLSAHGTTEVSKMGEYEVAMHKLARVISEKAESGSFEDANFNKKSLEIMEEINGKIASSLSDGSTGAGRNVEALIKEALTSKLGNEKEAESLLEKIKRCLRG